MVDRLRVMSRQLAWLDPAAEWIAGLAAEADGDPASARTQVIHAASGGLDALPLHRALAAEDLARVEYALGHDQAAGAVARDATERFAALGLQRHDGASDPGSGVLAGLSDRERDVVGLLVEGLSYVQIARELFVTRSTVSFHLTNVYAKTNTSGRHELVDLVRGG